MDQALLAKLRWRLLNQPDAILGRVLRAKFGVGEEKGAHKEKQRCSHI